MDTSQPFPSDWHVWRTQWGQFLAAAGEHFAPTDTRAPGKNFLADDIIGTWNVNGRDVELSEVTMPNFRDRRGDRVRYVGLTFILPGNITRAGDVVSTFAELAEALGLRRGPGGRYFAL